MRIYLDLAILLNFCVDFLLLAGTNRMAGYPWGLRRCLYGAVLGGIYGGLCLLPGLSFLGNLGWRILFLVLMGGAAFGFRPQAVRPTVLLVFLSLALGGVAQGLGKVSFLSVTAGAAFLALVCGIGFRGGVGNRELVEVELHRGERSLRLLALRDTGNTLTDPITGAAVLVADAESAQTLLGLSRAQLADPVGTVASGVLPGLRLIPYRAVGISGGLLLALRLDRVRIGNRIGDTLVAFAPEGLGGDGTYRALTGGMA